MKTPARAARARAGARLRDAERPDAQERSQPPAPPAEAAGGGAGGGAFMSEGPAARMIERVQPRGPLGVVVDPRRRRSRQFA